ncbi:MAG: CZB domain-containing protein [Nitrospirae bacterium]|nr:CZB domain-containing protein [Nitrospirota bacterium]
MKISWQIDVMLAILLFFALVSSVGVFNELDNMSHDGKIVNTTGKVRGSSQKVVKYALVAKYAEADRLMITIDQLISALINGNKEMDMPAPTDAHFIQTCKRVEDAWLGLKSTLTTSRQDASLHERLIKESDAFFALTNDMTTEAEHMAKNKVRNIKIIQIGILCLSVIIYIAIFLASRMKILKPLNLLMEQMHYIVNKDLKMTVNYMSNDEVGLLVGEMNRVVDFFSELINSTLVSINNVVSVMDLVRLKTDDTMEGANEQLSQSAQIATAIEQMSQTIADISRNASTASEMSTSAMVIASRGKDIAGNAVGTVNLVHNTTKELSSVIDALNKRINEIGSILRVINDIADQTNLLALNAAIEAARAGEQGRGFAVVADEVRKLAERTKGATTEISEKISAVQVESDKTTKSMQYASNEVSKATEQMNQVGTTLKDIVEAALEVRDQITLIATAMEQQSATSSDIVKNVERTTGISQEMVKHSDEVTSGINRMIVMSEELRKASSGFITKGGELLVLDLAKTDHRLWVYKISSCLKGAEHVDPAMLVDHTLCRLGKWYYTTGKALCGNLSNFKAIETPHTKLHALGKEIVSLYNKGDKQRSYELFKELEGLSSQIVRLLDETKNHLVGQPPLKSISQ